MQLTWRQFLVYLGAFTWLLREESEQGRNDNREDDLRAMAEIPELKARKKRIVDEAKQKLAEFDKRWAGKRGGEVKKVV